MNPPPANGAPPKGAKLTTRASRAWIKSRVPGGHQSMSGQLLDVAYTIENGADTREQSALNLIYTLSWVDRNFEIFGAFGPTLSYKRGGNPVSPRQKGQAPCLPWRGNPRTGHRMTAQRGSPWLLPAFCARGTFPL